MLFLVLLGVCGQVAPLTAGEPDELGSLYKAGEVELHAYFIEKSTAHLP